MEILKCAVHHLDFNRIDSCPVVDMGGCRVYTGHESHDSEAPAFLFVPGGYHGAWCYSHFLEFFSQRGIGCYAVDLPGHGALASSSTPDLDIEALASHLILCGRTLSRPLVLVGHSVGAIPTMLAAIQLEPKGLVLLAPSPPGNLPGALALPPVETGQLKAAPSEDEVRRRFLAVGACTQVDEVIKRLSPESPAVLNDRYRLRIQVDPSRITCPGICFEAGLDDEDRHPDGQDLAIAEFLGLEYERLEQQPHCMMYGVQWQESAEALLVWYQHHFESTR